jgi:hypothetical protein
MEVKEKPRASNTRSVGRSVMRRVGERLSRFSAGAGASTTVAQGGVGMLVGAAERGADGVLQPIHTRLAPIQSQLRSRSGM